MHQRWAVAQALRAGWQFVRGGIIYSHGANYAGLLVILALVIGPTERVGRTGQSREG